MQLIVLGAAAGGGFPQWNCRCPACQAAWRGEAAAQTQSSIAVSGDERHWFLVNASPDLRSQILATPALQPSAGMRHSPIAGVLVTNGDIDHIAGLLTLRERQPFTLYASALVHHVLAANPIFNCLDPDLVPRQALPLDVAVALTAPDGTPGPSVTAFAVPGKVPLFLEGAAVETEAMGGEAIGLEFRSGGKRALYIPGCATLPDWLIERIAGADLLLLDGTLWHDEEMIAAGLGQKTGRRMGHIPVSGPGGSLDALAAVPLGQRAYIHLNNSNPLLLAGSPERAAAAAAAWQVAYDGLTFRL